MNIKNTAASLFAILLLTGCEQKAEKISDEQLQVPQQQQQQYKQGKIDTHGTE